MRTLKKEIPKEFYDRARAACQDPKRTYLTICDADKEKLFGSAVLCGYGLYSCSVHEEDGKYICTYTIGDSCD